MAKKAELLTNTYDVIDVVPTANVAAGDVGKVEDIYGFYIVDVERGKDAAFVTRAGRVRVEKTAGQTWKAGELVYWSSNAGKFSNTRSNALVGYVSKPASQADSHGDIIFDGLSAALKA